MNVRKWAQTAGLGETMLCEPKVISSHTSTYFAARREIRDAWSQAHYKSAGVGVQHCRSGCNCLQHPARLRWGDEAKGSPGQYDDCVVTTAREKSFGGGHALSIIENVERHCRPQFAQRREAGKAISSVAGSKAANVRKEHERFVALRINTTWTSAIAEFNAIRAPHDAVARLWPVAQCLVGKAETEIEVLVAKGGWHDGVAREIASLSARYPECGSIPLDAIDADRPHHARDLRRCRLRHEAPDGAMPDYSKAPSRVELRRYMANYHGGMTFAEKAVVAFRTDEIISSECIVERSPLLVINFLGSAPKPAEENASLRELSAVMGPCMFQLNGTPVRFSRPQLRRMLGEAGVELDYRLSRAPK